MKALCIHLLVLLRAGIEQLKAQQGSLHVAFIHKPLALFQNIFVAA